MDNSIETGEEALPAAENPLGVTPSNDISEEDGCTGNISQLSGSQDVKERWLVGITPYNRRLIALFSLNLISPYL